MLITVILENSDFLVNGKGFSFENKAKSKLFHECAVRLRKFQRRLTLMYTLERVSRRSVGSIIDVPINANYLRSFRAGLEGFGSQVVYVRNAG